jgi:hypothetical protein
MRPALLNPLFAPITGLAGVGPQQDKLFRYLLGRREGGFRILLVQSLAEVTWLQQNRRRPRSSERSSQASAP